MTPEEADTPGTRRVYRRFLTGLGFTPWVTLTVVLFLVVVHLATGAWDVAHHRGGWLDLVIGDRSDRTLTAFGARTRWALRRHQAWRLLAYGGLHGGLLHVGMNTLALGGLGRIAESVYGGRRFLALLLLSTLGGGAASWLAGVGLSVGISGGVFGLMGALVAYGLWHRAALPHALRELFGRRLAPWVLVNLALGLPLAGVVDNACHLGGLVTGAIIGPFLADHILDNRRPSVRGDWLVLGINVGLIAWVVVGEIAR